MQAQERHPAHPVDENPEEHIGEPVVVDYEEGTVKRGGSDNEPE